MKKLILTIAFILFLFAGCRKTHCSGPEPSSSALLDLTFISSQVPLPQHKAVLIEDITGVRCINCPDGAKEAMNILAQKSEDSVVLMALYPTDIMNNFTHPYPDVPQLAAEISKTIVETLGIPQGLPSGFVDRTLFPGNSQRSIDYPNWMDEVNNRLQSKTPVNINLSRSLTNATLILEMNLAYNTLTPLNPVNPHRYALYLVENGIVSKQFDHSGANLNYVHNHVLRHTFSSPMGDSLTHEIVPGLTYIKQFKYEFPVSEFNIANCSIICVVLESNTEEVINVRKIKL